MASTSGDDYSQEGLCQFTTLEEVRRLLVTHICRDKSDFNFKSPRSEVFWTEKFEHKEPFKDSTTGILVHQAYSRKEIQGIVDAECHALHDAVIDPLHHTEGLEVLFTKNLETKFWLEDKDHEQVARTAWSLLGRMPAIPPSLPDDNTIDLIPSAYFTQNCAKSWPCLTTVALVQQTFIQLALDASVAMMRVKARGGTLGLGQTGSSGARERLRILDGTAELIAYCVKISSTSDMTENAQASWFVVRAYLWSFWQRLKTLHAHSFFAAFQYTDLDMEPPYLAQRNFMVSPGYSLARLTRENSESGRTSNMCTWVLSLVRSEPYSFGLDFKMIHQRYSSVLGQEKARCLRDSPNPCDGKHSNNCLRFYGATIDNQSAHDSDCVFSTGQPDREPKLRWNRDSFVRVHKGARAVVISAPDSTNEIHYCPASDRTMAISHVWSHGQGGRPEDGINRCLHQRYCHIAAQLDCDSYWMDTTCIPENHDLRQEAIMQINGVFSKSRAVLVCDKDLMKIDIGNLSMVMQESILAVILFSDWNTRAWTLLESMKGRNSIFLLCKNKRTVNFRDLLRNVLSGGSIDIAVFIWHIYHMLPIQPLAQGMSQIYRDLREGRVQDDIGSLLSYRPASRQGDDFVIWSLLDFSSPKPCSSAVTFWKSRVGKVLATGYLLSSAKRLRVHGLSWAPESPYATTRDHRQAPAKFHRPTGMIVTELGTILVDGFSATWRAFEFDSRLAKQVQRGAAATDVAQEAEIQKIRHKFLRYHEHGILIRPVFVHMGFSSEMAASFEAGLSEEGTLVAVCGSHKITTRTLKDERPEVDSYRWTWKGVFEWPDHVPLPPFQNTRLLIA